MFQMGEFVTTTVHAIGDRSEEVTGAVVEVRMSRKTPGRVLAYVVDTGVLGYGHLLIPAAAVR